MNSSFVNISSQRGPLCPILLHLSILRLSYWQSKYDEMPLSIKNAAPTTIGAAKRLSTLNLLYHRAKSRIFCAVFTVDGMVATQSDLSGDLPSRGVVQQVGHWQLSQGASVISLTGRTKFLQWNKHQFLTFSKTIPHIYLQSDYTGVKRNHSWFKFHKTHGKISRTINMPANSAGWVW